MNDTKKQPETKKSLSRRLFLQSGGAALSGAAFGCISVHAEAKAPEAKRAQQDKTVAVHHPRMRVPLSFIIDDSTCLVNMGHFCMPQFEAAWPKRDIYKKPWKTWPREIPDAFVRKFTDWCSEHGVKGKYSVVPYPCCVGWLDRELPGWSRRELLDSLALVRDHMLSNWDIHPEMITHTRVIDLRTGRPFEEISDATMENSFPQEKKSVDELASYLAYSLRILKNCDLPCDGITTPGGFGGKVKSELSLAVHQSVRDVFGSELPHYFKYISTGDESTHPKLEHVKGLESDDPQAVANVPAGTGDWFGSWDGDKTPEPDRYANKDATDGRMVELIEKNEPAVMLCHWPGLYTQGTEKGLQAFQRVVMSLESRFRHRMHWMKVSELGRYWAARDLSRIEKTGDTVRIQAPFGTPLFTLEMKQAPRGTPKVVCKGRTTQLKKVATTQALSENTWWGDQTRTVVCFTLPKGVSKVVFA